MLRLSFYSLLLTTLSIPAFLISLEQISHGIALISLSSTASYPYRYIVAPIISDREAEMIAFCSA